MTNCVATMNIFCSMLRVSQTKRYINVYYDHYLPNEMINPAAFIATLSVLLSIMTDTITWAIPPPGTHATHSKPKA